MKTPTKTTVYRFIEKRDGSYCLVMLQEVATGDLLWNPTFTSLKTARQWCLDNDHGFLDPDE